MARSEMRCDASGGEGGQNAEGSLLFLLSPFWARTRGGDNHVCNAAGADDKHAEHAVRQRPQRLQGVERQDEPARLARGREPALAHDEQSGHEDMVRRRGGGRGGGGGHAALDIELAQQQRVGGDGPVEDEQTRQIQQVDPRAAAGAASAADGAADGAGAGRSGGATAAAAAAAARRGRCLLLLLLLLLVVSVGCLRESAGRTMREVSS